MSESASLPAAARQALHDDRPIRREIADRGVLHIERRLPFLVVYRRPESRPDKGTSRLVTTQSAYLIVGQSTPGSGELMELVATVATTVAEKLGAFLLFEIWSAPVQAATDGRPLPVEFRIVTAEQEALAGTVEVLAERLAELKAPGFRIGARVVRGDQVRPPEVASPLLPPIEEDESKWHHIGVEIPAIFHGASGDVLYPGVLDRLRRPLGRALRLAVSRFCADNDIRLTDRRAISLAPREFERSAAECDRQLLEVSNAFDLLLLTTPINSESAWREFQGTRFERPPVFYYRPLPFDPARLKRALFTIPLERIRDPVVQHLFHEKRLELDQRISLLRDRGTSNFIYGSLQLFGGVDTELLSMARSILHHEPKEEDEAAAAADPDDTHPIDAHGFRRAVASEIEWYRRRNREFDPEIEVRDDIPAGVMVSAGSLLVSSTLHLAPARVRPLIQHELGTHCLTHFNGTRQRIVMLAQGLARYESTQEGLAVLAEHAVGGLTLGRARVLAGRVVAVHGLIEGKSFVDVFHILCDEHRMAPRTAYNITMRVFRGGGLTKDAVYLKGIIDVMEFLDGSDSLDLLLLGKLSTRQAPLLGELVQRGIVRPPALRPRYVLDATTRARLLASGENSPVELLRGQP